MSRIHGVQVAALTFGMILSMGGVSGAASEQPSRPRATTVTREKVAAVGAVSGSVWKPIGPSPISEPNCCNAGIEFKANGRVNSIAVDPTNPNRVYLGSAGGGLWRSENGGSTWIPLTDQEASLGIGSSHAIAIDPTNPDTIYAGTSSFALLAQSRPRPMDFTQSKGVLKSIDAGASWIVLGSGIPSGNNGNAMSLFSRTNISTILVDPADGDTLYLAAGRGGTVLVSGGLFRSTDGGFNWTAGTGGTGVAESLVLDTSSPPSARVLYAGLNGAGVLKSTDGGQTWTPVLTPTTPAVVAAGASGFDKVMVALAPTATPLNPAGQVVYVTLLVGGTGVIFENTNGGAAANWTRRNGTVVSSLPELGSLVGGAFSDMVVDPASPGDGANDLIYWGGASQYLSTDSGNTFAEIGQIHGTHGDHQTFLVVPQPGGPSVVYAGDDGGIWKSTDRGATWSGTNQPGSPPTINAGGLQIGTFYALAMKQDASASVTLGGTHDSGRVRTTGGLTWSGTSDDGIDVVFDKIALGDAYAIGNGCGGDCVYKSTDSGASWSDITPATIPLSERATFLNRLAIDPSNAGHVYVGGSAGSVFQTIDGGTTFRSLGTPAPGKYVSSLDVAPSQSDNLVAAANDLAGSNMVVVTTNALDPSITFLDITRDLPARFVTRVAFDPADATVIYATLAGFASDTPGRPGHVYRTTLDAAGWTDISPPHDVPVNAIALDGTATPAVIYVGTDVGVLRSTDGGSTWAAVDDVHLPNAAVAALDLNLQAGVLRAATWGRGVFELAAPIGPVISVTPAALNFGETCATGSDLPIDVSSIGTQNLTVSSVQRIAGAPNFTVSPSPTTPLTLAPDEDAVFTVHYTPNVPAGPDSAAIRVSSNDPTAPSVDLLATGTLETTPPIISSAIANPSTLWPPNHKMVQVSVTVDVTDNCDAGVTASCTITSIASNEPVLGHGAGETSPDWEITGSLTANLRAERDGSGTGRIYTITVQCTDSASNSATRTTTVTVPHD